jgi:hypothetical protein
MNLVAYAGKWYKLASVWVLLGIGVISAAQPHLVDLGVSATMQGYVTAILSVLGVVARLIGQPNIEDSAKD